MILHVLAAASGILNNRIVVVVGHEAEKVKKVIRAHYHVIFAHQEQQIGTGHAVRCAAACLPSDTANVVIMCGDVPLVRPETIRQLISKHLADQNDLTVTAMRLDDPTGYGRIVCNDSGTIVDIVEETDVTSEQKKISVVNAGMYCVSADFLKSAIERITTDNAQEEYYLTDIVSIGFDQKRNMGLFLGDNPDEFKGVNTKQDLADVQRLLKNRLV